MADSPALVPEIEITPEMIEAGSALICEHFHDTISHSGGVVRLLAVEVFQAMSRAKPGK